MPFTYGLYPWTWNSLDSCHEPPAGAYAVLDLRPEPEQARAGQSSGWGFFAWPDMIPGNGPNIAPPADVIPLGYGDCRELQPTTAQRDELRLRLGLSSNPSGTFLVDVIADVLGSLADPTGQSGPKPLLPTREGSLEIHLSFHSRVWAEVFDGAALFGQSPTGKHNRIRDVLRTDLETANKSGGPDLVAKVLGSWCDKWGVDYSQATRWRNLMRPVLLAEMLGKRGGKFSPKKPQTSYSDNFDRASLGTDWTSVSGTASITSSTVFELASGGTTRYARYEFDVSSADHWTENLQGGGSSTADRLMPCCRFASAASTFYHGYARTSNQDSLAKTVAGTLTALSTTSGGGGSNGTYRINVSGSSLTLTRNGVSRTTATDTGITGNTRGGIYRNGTTGTPNADDWLIDDGITAGQPMALRVGGMRHGWSRVGRGW